MNMVRTVKIEGAGTDFVILRDGDRRLRVTFADSLLETTFTKEACAQVCRNKIGQEVAIPVEGPPFISFDVLPGDFAGARKITGDSGFVIASVELC
jgi:hypothetical protein